RWLGAALAIGLLASVVQTLRGAHYPSHSLWTLLICASVSLAGWHWAQPRAAAAAPRPRWHPGRDGLRLLRPLLLPMACTLAALWLSRLGLALWQAERVAQQQAWGTLLSQGLRFDGVLLGYIWVLPAALTPWMALHPRTWRAWAAFLRVCGGASLLLVCFMELATPAFVAQYDARPNYLFVEYLGYAREVGGTLIKDYPLHLLAAALLLPATAWAYARLSRPAQPPAAPRVWQALLLSALLLVSLAIAGRGALGHRAANPASAA